MLNYTTHCDLLMLLQLFLIVTVQFKIEEAGNMKPSAIQHCLP